MRNNINLIAALIFAAALVLGQLYVNYSSLGYIEAALIWLAAVVAGGSFWLGSRR